MAWDEWEQIKADVADRGSVHMQLNQLTGGGGGPGGGSPGGGATLQHSAPPWSHAAGVASDLSNSMSTAKSDLDTADQGVSAGLQGLASLGSLTTVLQSWDDRLTAVQNECKGLHPALRAVSVALGETDHGVGSKVNGVHPRAYRRDVW